jgi:hypothetical protein
MAARLGMSGFVRLLREDEGAERPVQYHTPEWHEVHSPGAAGRNRRRFAKAAHGSSTT